MNTRIPQRKIAVNEIRMRRRSSIRWSVSGIVPAGVVRFRRRSRSRIRCYGSDERVGWTEKAAFLVGILIDVGRIQRVGRREVAVAVAEVAAHDGLVDHPVVGVVTGL